MVIETLEILVVTVVVITLEFVVPISYFVYVLSDMVVGALTGVMPDSITGFVSSIGVEVLADANVNDFASLVTAWDFGLPKPLGEFSC